LYIIAVKTAAKLVLLLAVAALASACGENLSEADKSDPGIRARVEANLAAHRELDLKFITLDVHSGIVTVSGLVHSWEEKQLVQRVVNQTGGFQQAIFNLAIQE
jgi:osmotically-inducible protein OsmY